MADFDLSSTFISALHKPASLLPIARHRESLLYVIETYPVTIVVGQTGSGKTTQIPQFLERAGWCASGKVIAVTQPRRVAATTVATRVAEEMGCKVGEDVGYSIRFEDVTSSKTRIKFLTDGLLLREALVDPLLSRYSVIMVDEAHERSLSTDILLGVLKKIRKKRADLRIVVSSATLQAEDFLAFFAGDEAVQGAGGNEMGGSIGRIISLEGRMYPVDIHYTESAVEDYLEKGVQTVFDIHSKEPAGDILVFLTGREEIDSAAEAISERAAQLHPRAQSLLPLPLYAGLPAEQQEYVFSPAPDETRKVILATNIAEASVTIPGIVYVIDSGFVKQRAFNAASAIETLTATPVSQASATQRAGRAGRTQPGKCYRLYTEGTYESLPPSSIPEIQRSDLAPAVLQLKALGIDNVARFSFLTAPPSALLIRALELLYSLGALDPYAKLTSPLGERLAELSVPPMLAKSLLSSPSFSCAAEMLNIAAMTSVSGSVFAAHDVKSGAAARRKFAADEGDHLSLLNAYAAFTSGTRRQDGRWSRENGLNYGTMLRAVSIRGQLARYLARYGVQVEEMSAGGGGNPNLLPRGAGVVVGGRDKGEQIRRCLTAGYFAQAAKMQADGTFRNVGGKMVLHAHPSSLLFNRKAEWVVFHEVMETGQKVYIRNVTKIEKSWLLEYAADYYSIRA